MNYKVNSAQHKIVEKNFTSNKYRIKSLIIGGLLLMVTSSVVAEDFCAKLADHSIKIVANGVEGRVGNSVGGGLEAVLHKDGGVTFKTVVKFGNEPTDTLAGFCKKRHIVMTRKRKGGFTQQYNGWLFERKRKNSHNEYIYGKCQAINENVMEAAGVFSHNGVNEYGWYGQLVHTPATK